jgi:hypothetical protein
MSLWSRFLAWWRGESLESPRYEAIPPRSTQFAQTMMLPSGSVCRPGLTLLSPPSEMRRRCFWNDCCASAICHCGCRDFAPTENTQ